MAISGFPKKEAADKETWGDKNPNLEGQIIGARKRATPDIKLGVLATDIVPGEQEDVETVTVVDIDENDIPISDPYPLDTIRTSTPFLNIYNSTKLIAVCLMKDITAYTGKEESLSIDISTKGKGLTLVFQSIEQFRKAIEVISGVLAQGTGSSRPGCTRGSIHTSSGWHTGWWCGYKFEYDPPLLEEETHSKKEN